MALDRREFLIVAGGASLPDVRQEVRDLVRQACLGRVVFCRVSHVSMADAIAALRSVFPDASPDSISGPTIRYPHLVAAFEQARHYQVVICGSQATLVMDHRGYRRFA